VLVDVGGTLWPDHWPLSDGDRLDRFNAMKNALPGVSASDIAEVIATITTLVDEGSAAPVRRAAERLVKTGLARHRLPVDSATVRAARQALCTNLGRSVTPFAGAGELLAGIKSAGLTCVILSNTTFRDAEMYGRDFAALGWDGFIDGCITSVDVGCGKPDRRIFCAAIRAAAVDAHAVAMIGNSEDADIVPAIELGLRALRVALEDPLPATSVADAVTDSLTAARDVLLSWA
jgi:FMN phosphatase YigB (HAD superfamily)